MCNFLSSVSLQQRFEMAGECYSSFTVKILFSKERIVHPQRHESGPTPKERPQPVLTPYFIHFVSPCPEPARCKLGIAREGACLFQQKFLFQSMEFSFVPFSWAFPFLYLLATTSLYSFFLF